jgi:hypothetical protein
MLMVPVIGYEVQPTNVMLNGEHICKNLVTTRGVQADGSKIPIICPIKVLWMGITCWSAVCSTEGDFWPLSLSHSHSLSLSLLPLSLPRAFGDTSGR